MKTIKNQSRLRRAANVGALVCAIAGSAFLAHAQSTSPVTPQPAADSTASATVVDPAISPLARAFVQDAAQANQTEIAMANVAESRSKTDAVKEFARMMRADHQQNFAELQQLAQSHAMILDSALTTVNQHAVNKLQKTSDGNLDKEFSKVMLKEHVNAIKRFETASTEISEPYLKTYAQNTLPALRKHLQHAEVTARAAGVDESTISSIVKSLPSEDAQRAVNYKVKSNQD